MYLQYKTDCSSPPPSSEVESEQIMGSAFTEHRETIKGSLAPGKLADLVVLCDDIFTIPPEAIENPGRHDHLRRQMIYPRLAGERPIGKQLPANPVTQINYPIRALQLS